MLRAALTLLALAACAPDDAGSDPPVEDTGVNGDGGDGGDGGAPESACAEGRGNAALAERLEQALAASTASGAVVGIATADGLRVQAFGTLGPDTDVAMSSSAIFDIGSIQKNFRWVLLHRLAEAGELSIDQHVNDHLSSPELPDVTYRHLTMHTSGIMHWDETDFPVAAFEDLSREWRYEETIEYLTGATGGPWMPDFEQGVDFHYSNYGPLIAGRAVEELLGSDVRELTDEYILSPLGLDATTHQAYDDQPARLVDGFWADGVEHDWTDDYDDTMALSSGAGSLLYSDACDMRRYSQGVFEDEQFLTGETIDDALARQVDWVLPDGTDVGEFAAGFGSFVLFPEGLWGHFGSGQHGHSSVFMHRISDGATFVVLTNVAADGGEELGRPGDYFEVHKEMIPVMDDMTD